MKEYKGFTIYETIQNGYIVRLGKEFYFQSFKSIKEVRKKIDIIIEIEKHNNTMRDY